MIYIISIIAVFIIIAVVLQSRGTNLGGAFGGGGESYRSKKGVEKFLFYATIILGILFAAVSIVRIVLS
jgi:protein translocase SecG subunit